MTIIIYYNLILWAAKTGYTLVAASFQAYFCKLYVGFPCQPTPANKNIACHFSRLPLLSLPQGLSYAKYLSSVFLKFIGFQNKINKFITLIP